MAEDLRFKEQAEKAYNYAVYCLSLRLRTEGEIRDKLRLKNYQPEIVNRVIEELNANRYLDDQRYGEVYLDNLKKYKTFGYYGIKKKLMEKRLPAEIIENVLRDGLNEEEEIKIAARFFKKRKTAVGDWKEKQKLAQILRAKGFRTAVVAKMLD